MTCVEVLGAGAKTSGLQDADGHIHRFMTCVKVLGAESNTSRLQDVTGQIHGLSCVDVIGLEAFYGKINRESQSGRLVARDVR